MFTPSNDMDHARRLIREIMLFSTHPQCDPDARGWLLQELERVRSEAKALLRHQQPERAPLTELFKTTAAGPTTPTKRGPGRPRKSETPPVTPVGSNEPEQPFKQSPATPVDRSQLEQLFNRRPAPTPPTSSSTATPPKIKIGDEESPSVQMRKQLSGLFKRLER
jgi:hypothetical protein